MHIAIERILLLLFWLNSFNIIQGLGVHEIHKTHVINAEDESEPIVLDCEYEADHYNQSLLVKWLKDGKPIYQWIKGHKPSVFPKAISKGSIDEEFEVSSNPNYKHRAIKFLDPTKELSGNYSCLVVMNSTQSIQIHFQIVDVSESNFELNYEKQSNETLITCEIENVYPKPKLSITSDDDDIELTNIFENNDPEYNGLFNASLKVSAHNLDENDEITCTVSFAGTQFNLTKSLMSSAPIAKTISAVLSVLTLMFVTMA